MKRNIKNFIKRYKFNFDEIKNDLLGFTYVFIRARYDNEIYELRNYSKNDKIQNPYRVFILKETDTTFIPLLVTGFANATDAYDYLKDKTTSQEFWNGSAFDDIEWYFDNNYLHYDSRNL